ncbi:MAG: NusG domain II-containing protein [Exilispira sp.]
MKKTVRFYFKKNDLIIYFIIVLISIGSFFIRDSNSKIDRSKLLVEIDYNKERYFYPLYKDNLIILKNGLIIVEINDNKVRVKDSDCQDKICMKKGWIERSGQFIICMPNKLLVKIIGEEEYDSITY